MVKYYVDVVKYANKNALTLEKAHEEIQPELFAMGYNWVCANNHNKVILKYAEYLELNMNRESAITLCPSNAFTENDYDVEITFDRNVSLYASYENIKKSVEYVEFNGKQYEKAKIEQALKLIEGDE